MSVFWVGGGSLREGNFREQAAHMCNVDITIKVKTVVIMVEEKEVVGKNQDFCFMRAEEFRKRTNP
jgi:hypothetical protein